jgi:hypothetical protein
MSVLAQNPKKAQTVLIEFEDGTFALFAGAAIETTARVKRLYLGEPHELPSEGRTAFLRKLSVSDERTEGEDDT